MQASGDADRFSGIVLCGGSSTRMGRDKATILIGGVPMARRVADALRAAGATEVIAVGGDAEALHRMGLATWPDDEPGEGPLAATLTALRAARQDTVVVTGCDLVHPDARAVTRVLAGLAAHPAVLVAVPVSGGHRQWTHAAWRRAGSVLLQDAYARGIRSLRQASEALPLVEVTDLDPRWLADADTPADLPAQRGAPSNGR